MKTCCNVTSIYNQTIGQYISLKDMIETIIIKNYRKISSIEENAELLPASMSCLAIIFRKQAFNLEKLYMDIDEMICEIEKNMEDL